MTENNPRLDQKAALRRVAAARRKTAMADLRGDGVDPGALVRDRIAGVIDLNAYRAMSGFLPIGSEVDSRPTLVGALSRGLDIALPAVIEPAAPLVFRRWRPGDPLVKEAFGTSAPAPDAPLVVPDILLVPLLAFDRAGYRLGYGGGFYDRTLERLRAAGRAVLAVGIGLAAQEVDAVPREGYDQPLDWIVTETDAICCRQSAG